MRIGLISPYSLSVPGGVQAQVLGLAGALRNLGHQVRVLAPCDGPPPNAGVTPLGASIPTAVNGSVAPIAPDVSAQLRLLRILRDEQFDVLNLHEPMVPGPNMTACLIKSAPLVGTFHAAGHIGPYIWARPAIAWLANRLDKRVAVSQDAIALAEGSLGGSYELLHNGIDVAEFRDAKPWPTEGPTIFFIGRHEPRKGLAVLLEAMSDLPAHVRLWVAGTGPDTNELKREHAGDPRIEWLGRISDAEKAQRIRAASVFCAPSLGGESFGIVLLEGMAAGTPTVASNLPGYRNVARPDKDALLVPPGDAQALAEAILRVLKDSSLAEELTRAGLARAQTFSMESLARQYLRIFNELVDSK
ncbi:MAG: glycosyltransferase family 4 protein [Acidimicrobiia bacterium]